MLRKTFFQFGFVAGLLLCAGLSLVAQTAPVRGIVKVQRSDGTQVPVADALVEPYRIDIDQGKLPSTKTNKNGEFIFVGFSPANRYVLSVSGPGLTPTVSNPVRGGMEDVAILIFPGDGRQLTEAETREIVKQGTKAGTGQSEEDRKKALADYEKQKAKYEEEKKKADNINRIVNASLKDGEAAFKAKDYSTAVSKFDEGIDADPEFEGTAPVLLNYKGVSLKSRGFEAYERSTKMEGEAKKAELEKARIDFDGSIKAFDQGLKVIAGATVTDPAAQANLAKVKQSILTNLVESYRLIVRTKADTSKAKDAMAAYDQYFEVETDAARKTKARLDLGDMLREAGEAEPSIVAYRAVLEVAPDNPDALAGLGLSLFNVGVIEDDKAKMQEGLNIMQKFADSAPDTHPMKLSVKQAVEYLKTEQKLAPQKTAPARRRP